jgi:hypothetical protein
MVFKRVTKTPSGRGGKKPYNKEADPFISGHYMNSQLDNRELKGGNSHK